ncbi:MAG: hypothetical protein ACYDCN_05860 [Bacteroidia bacterium]
MSIENELLEVIKVESQKFQNNPKVLEYEKATVDFKKMVEQGLIKERGYNLQTVESAHLNRVSFNAI